MSQHLLLGCGWLTVSCIGSLKQFSPSTIGFMPPCLQCLTFGTDIWIRDVDRLSQSWVSVPGRLWQHTPSAAGTSRAATCTAGMRVQQVCEYSRYTRRTGTRRAPEHRFRPHYGRTAHIMSWFSVMRGEIKQGYSLFTFIALHDIL